MSKKQEFNRLLKEYISSGEETLKQQLQNILVYPSSIQNSTALPEDHPLKREAVVIHDGFECVTNGMADPELIRQVRSISDESLFQPWRDMILSFICLYGNDIDGLRAGLENLRKNSVSKRLVPVFEAFIDKDPSSLEEQDSRLFLSVFKRNDVIADLAEQLQDCREAGLMDHFLKALSLFLRELKIEAPQWLEKGALWALDQLIQEEPLSEDIIPYLCVVFNKSEAFRLLSRVSFEFDLDRSLFFWIESIKELLKNEQHSLLEIEVRVEILEEMWQLVQERYDVTDQYRAGVKGLLGELDGSLNHLYPEKQWNLHLILSEEEQRGSHVQDTPRPARFVQLELAF